MSTPSDTAPPNDPPTDPPTTEEPVATPPAEPAPEPRSEPAGPSVDPLEAPLPPEFTAKELIAKKREEKGPLFACAFACCCCFLCYEKLEFVLDFICCKTCK